MARTKKLKLHSAPAAPAAATLARDPHHDAASRWCTFARGVLERLIDDANRLLPALRDPRHPLHGAYKDRELAEAVEHLADASNAILNADTYPPCLIDVPNPLLDD